MTISTATRASGILLHPTSLPGPYGLGDLGPGAFQFVDFLEAAGQRVWQVMPLGPTGFGDSPYQCFSAFAGNPYLISLDALAAQGWLDRAALAAAPVFSRDRADYGPVIDGPEQNDDRQQDRGKSNMYHLPCTFFLLLRHGGSFVDAQEINAE